MLLFLCEQRCSDNPRKIMADFIFMTPKYFLILKYFETIPIFVALNNKTKRHEKIVYATADELLCGKCVRPSACQRDF